MFGLGIPELLIVLVILLVVFGAGWIKKFAGELGSGIRNFREAVADKEAKKKE